MWQWSSLCPPPSPIPVNLYLNATRSFTPLATGSWPKPAYPPLPTSAILALILQSCHSCLKQWAKRLNPAHIRETWCITVTNLLDVKEEQRHLTTSELNLTIVVKLVVHRAICDRMCLLKQWVNIKCAISGDQNAKLFHVIGTWALRALGVPSSSRLSAIVIRNASRGHVHIHCIMAVPFYEHLQSPYV